MKKLFTILVAGVASAFAPAGLKTLHDFKTTTLDGKEFNFADLKGKKVLIVNTASECGYTPQYVGLEGVYQMYKDKNFVVIGFPCNDFGGQEPGNNNDIKAFCSRNYGVTFPIMDKISVKSSPIYQWLTSKTENGVLDATVKWNFNKFLIDEKGRVVKYFPSKVEPTDDEIIKWIEGK